MQHPMGFYGIIFPFSLSVIDLSQSLYLRTLYLSLQS